MQANNIISSVHNHILDFVMITKHNSVPWGGRCTSYKKFLSETSILI